MRLLIRGGTIVDAGTSAQKPGTQQVDVLVSDGIVAAIGEGLDAGDCVVFDAQGCCVCPGFIDMHVHFREPGREDEETVKTGTRAAAMGGFTAVAIMPNTSPVADNQAVVGFVLARAAAEGIVRVMPVGAITKGLAGQEMAEIGELVKSGVVGVSDDGKAVANPSLMRRVLEYAGMFGIPVMAHEEESAFAEGDMNEGITSTLLGLRGISRLAEDLMVARDLILAEETGGRLHICHVSTKRSVSLIRDAKARGVRVTAEATPHHFSLTQEAVASWDTNTKVNPPLRSEDDRLAVIAGLSDGTIDAIASDHAPHSLEEKDVEYTNAANGLIGLETAVPLAMTKLVKAGHMSVVDVVNRFTTGPARALGLAIPSLEVGRVADITVVDMRLEQAVDAATFESKSRNTPFAGMILSGWPVLTVVGGRIAMCGRRICE